MMTPTPSFSNNKSTLFLGDLSTFCSELDIHHTFSPFGEVVEIKIMRSEETSRNLCYGFIKFADPSAANRAMNGLNGVLFCGRNLRIGWASFKSKKEPRTLHQDRLETASVHVSYLSYQLQQLITEESLRILFSAYGVVVDTSIKKSYLDESINRQCGYGFVHFSATMQGLESALAAVASLNDATIAQVSYKCSVSHNLEKQLLEQQMQSQQMQMQHPQHQHHSHQQQMRKGYGPSPHGYGQGQHGHYNSPCGGSPFDSPLQSVHSSRHASPAPSQQHLQYFPQHQQDSSRWMGSQQSSQGHSSRTPPTAPPARHSPMQQVFEQRVVGGYQIQPPQQQQSNRSSRSSSLPSAAALTMSRLQQHEQDSWNSFPRFSGSTSDAVSEDDSVSTLSREGSCSSNQDPIYFGADEQQPSLLNLSGTCLLQGDNQQLPSAMLQKDALNYDSILNRINGLTVGCAADSDLHSSPRSSGGYSLFDQRQGPAPMGY